MSASAACPPCGRPLHQGQPRLPAVARARVPAAHAGCCGGDPTSSQDGAAGAATQPGALP
jgi:hypothetical protein